jgi:phosphatidylserine/phosphatidylglycerophosphate/cardiolipin synthase-like enzyme
MRAPLVLSAALGALLGCSPGDEGGVRMGSSLHSAPGTVAEDWLVPLDHGLWADPEFEGTVRGYVDFSVRNYAYDKTLALRSRVTRANGVVEQYLYHLEYRGTEADGRERWGTDLIELYPESPHHGDITAVDFGYQVVVDADGDGQDDLMVSESVYRLAGPEELASPAVELGVPWASGSNPDDGRHGVDTSLADSFDGSLPELEVFFSPYDDTEQAVIAQIEAVTEAQRADPGGHHSIHASIFDINDERITDALLEAHAAGVELRLLTAGYHMEPWRSWETEYLRLQRAGVDLLGVVRDEDSAASMHTKIAIFDGEVVCTGSYNWETVSADDNAEDMVMFRSPELAAVYERMLAAVAAEPYAPWPVDGAAPLQVYYSQEHELAEVVIRALEAARDEVWVAMFTLRSMGYHDAQGGWHDVLDALVDAQRRGVDVHLLLEENIADEGEYYGTVTPDDPTDEELAAQGIEVIEIDIDDAGNPYAAMHHKFAVIDGETVLVGSANWASMTQLSDDDLLVIHDSAVADRFLGEITNLRHHYQDGFDASTAPSTPVEVAVYHDGTTWGEGVVLVGDIPELGAWQPSEGVVLDPAGWPWWTATVDLPAGTHFAYKAVVTGPLGTRWEHGENRDHTVDPSGHTDSLTFSWNG